MTLPFVGNKPEGMHTRCGPRGRVLRAQQESINHQHSTINELTTRCKNGAILVQLQPDPTKPDRQHTFQKPVGYGRVRSPLVAFGYQVPKKGQKSHQILCFPATVEQNGTLSFQMEPRPFHQFRRSHEPPSHFQICLKAVGLVGFRGFWLVHPETSFQ